VVGLLLKQQPSRPALHHALASATKLGNLQAMAILMAAGARVGVENDASSLIAAVQGQSWSVARMLLLKGAPVNWKSPEGLIALHHAVGNGDLELVRLLLQYGAALDVPDGDGRTPLVQTIQSDRTDIVELHLAKDGRLTCSVALFVVEATDRGRWGKGPWFWTSGSPPRAISGCSASPSSG
jgi:ankyrin repeat protein